MKRYPAAMRFLPVVVVVVVACGSATDKEEPVVIGNNGGATGNNGDTPMGPPAGTPNFDPATCVTEVGGSLVSCYDGTGNAQGIRFHFAEVPALDQFGAPYMHRYFYTEDSFGVRLCGDAVGVSPYLATQLGIGDAECSVTRVWDTTQPGYQTFDAAFCVRPDRSEAGFVVEPFQQPPFQVIYGPFNNTCELCSPEVTAFCAGAG